MAQFWPGGSTNRWSLPWEDSSLPPLPSTPLLQPALWDSWAEVRYQAMESQGIPTTSLTGLLKAPSLGLKGEENQPILPNSLPGKPSLLSNSSTHVAFRITLTHTLGEALSILASSYAANVIWYLLPPGPHAPAPEHGGSCPKLTPPLVLLYLCKCCSLFLESSSLTHGSVNSSSSCMTHPKWPVGSEFL